MAQNLSSEREAIAIAACDVAGRERPLGAQMRPVDRAYLFACPSEFDEKYSVDTLSDHLAEIGLPHGVDWDRNSKFFGVRFVSKDAALSSGVRKFSGTDARKAWEAWKSKEAEMASCVIEAARLSASGASIDFESESDLVADPKRRRRSRIHGERD